MLFEAEPDPAPLFQNAAHVEGRRQDAAQWPRRTSVVGRLRGSPTRGRFRERLLEHAQRREQRERARLGP